jgi:NADPH:quinone reductase-like Zn-dependent oxidoreductase
VNPLDWHLIKGKPYIARLFFGLRRPKTTKPGVDVSGRIAAVGGKVTQFKPGDEVFGFCYGAFAEYVCTSESAIVLKPANVTFEQAASVPVAAITAIQGLRDKGKIQPGQKVLVIGASGGVGTLTVQIAKHFGAHVTGVCSSRNVDMVRSIGADRVIDYTRDGDFTRSEDQYDLIYDLVGNRSLFAYRRIMAPNGLYLGAGILGSSMIGLVGRGITSLVCSWFISQRFVLFGAKRSQADLILMQEFMRTGKVTPVVDKIFPLSKVPDAIKYMAKGHARGKVVIAVKGKIEG